MHFAESGSEADGSGSVNAADHNETGRHMAVITLCLYPEMCSWPAA